MSTRAEHVRDDFDPFAEDDETYPDPFGDDSPPLTHPAPPLAEDDADPEPPAPNPEVAEEEKGKEGKSRFGRGKPKKEKKPGDGGKPKKKPGDGEKPKKETLVRHEKPGKPRKKTMREVFQSARRILWSWLPFLSFVLVPRFLAPKQTTPEFYLTHLGFILVPLVPFLMRLTYAFRNHQRTHPPRNKAGRPTRPPQPPLPPARQWSRDVWDIVANLDHLIWRIAYVVLFVAAIAMSAHFYPLAVSTFQSVPNNPNAVRNILLAMVGPLTVYTVAGMRCSQVIKERAAEIEECYIIAKATLGYPKTTPKNATGRTMRVCTPWLAVDVKKWSALYEIDKFFVAAPEDLSVDDVSKWDDFAVNLNAKMPRPEEWRVQRDNRGRGAEVGPANYPTAVLWDGEVDPDPLTFYLGINLETGERQQLTLNDTSPHLAVSGGTSSGKTSLAEIIAAQVLVKPMPWDPTLHGMVVLVDPKGPLARRWAGRPGVVVANGQMDAAEPNDDGTPVTGPLVMASCMEWLEEEHQRRASVLARYPDVATWVHLPDEVKKKERFFPIFVILDEYIDHTDIEKANGDERIEKENAARNVTTRLASWHARKYRNVGMHSCIIAQRVNMSLIGNVLMGNLPVRAITGQMDRSQMETMFGTTDVPQLPATRVVYENGERKVKTIPGRARIMNALGQQINKVQVMWFGGKSNSDTLDKWLPRGEVPPNGDFSLPPGKPRTPADFDAEGNFIGATASTPRDLVDDLPMDGHEPNAADFDPTHLPSSVDEDDGWGEVGGAPRTEKDPDAVFPTAKVEAQRCAEDGCVNDAASTCSSCGSPRCEYHLKSAPDPGHTALLCQTCYSADPLVSSGIAEVYALMHGLSLKAGLVLSYEVMDYDAGVIATVSTPRRQKVVQVTATEGEITARSKSGTVTGSEVSDRVRQVVGSYVERKEREQAGAGEAK